MIGGLLGWIVFGGIAGLIVKAIMTGKDPAGAVVAIPLGIAGSVVGGMLFARGLLAGHSIDHQAVGGWIGAIFGSLLLLRVCRKYVVGKSVEV